MTLLTFGMIYLACLCVLLAVVFQDSAAKGGQEPAGASEARPRHRRAEPERPTATHGAAGLVFSTHH